MAFDILLLILFTLLVVFILFRQEILAFFEKKPKLKRRNRDDRETKETAQKQQSQREVRTQKPIPRHESLKSEKRERERREKEKREADAKAFAKQKAAKEALAKKEELAKKEARERAAAKRISTEKAAKALEEARKAELARKAKEEKAKREAAEAEQKAAAEKIAKALEESKKAEAAKKELPKGDYPDFSTSRLLDMGLSQEDADTFVLELIEQIDDHIPQIETATEAGNFDQVERLTHSIKGSATNLGIGGVADVLVDFNTYCKSGKDKEIILAYLDQLKRYQEKLKSQYL